MSSVLWFIIWAGLIFLMMRYGCGAHVMGHRHSQKRGDGAADLRWVPPDRDTDPVCGKRVRTADAKPSVWGGLVYYFCSRECREIFEAAPQLYTGGNHEVPTNRLEDSHA